MKCIILGSTGFDTIEYHLCDALNHLGHPTEVKDVFGVGMSGALEYVLRKTSNQYDYWTAKQTARVIAKIAPDLVIVTYRHLHPAIVENIKDELPKVIMVHINPDSMLTLQRQQVFAADFDYYFTKDPFMLRFMREKAGLKAFYLPESFNPRVHVKPEVSKEDLEEELDTDVIIFGTIYPYRIRVIERLLAAGVKLKLYGKKAKYFPKSLNKYFTSEYLTGANKSRILYGSRIVYNLFHYAEVEGVNCKYFEVNGVGAFQLCDYRPTLREYSPVAPSRYAFRTIEESIDLIRYYLRNKNERHEIAERQGKHFAIHHTYDQRVEQVMGIISR